MLWSLAKILLFVAAVAALTLGAGYLTETGPGIRIAVANTEFTLGPLQAVIAALALLLLFWIALKLAALAVAVLKFLNGDETALSRYFDRNREKRGYEALADGMMALASGEGQLAMSKAAKAERFLNRPELTNLLSAQAAEITGDKSKAEEVYRRLLSDGRTRFVGVRGLMKQKLAEGDTDTALKLAEKAFALKPRHVETQDALLKLQAESKDWPGARKTLEAKLKHGSLPRDVHKRRDAVLALSEARDVLAKGNSIEAREAAIEANRLSPDLIPAAVMAARNYIADGKPRYAARVIKKTWATHAHPDLAAVFADIAPEETTAERRKRFRALTGMNPDHPETRMLLAELAIADRDYPAARSAISDLVENEPTARALALMAAIERGEGSEDAVVRGWLTKALSAPRGPHWVCGNCQSIHADWAPVCDNCGSFDTLGWKEPAASEVAMPASTEMLPLIVGAPDTAPIPDEVTPAQPEPDATADVAMPVPEVAVEGEVVALGGTADSQK